MKKKTSVKTYYEKANAVFERKVSVPLAKQNPEALMEALIEDDFRQEK